jgi:hypothetical protein
MQLQLWIWLSTTLRLRPRLRLRLRLRLLVLRLRRTWRLSCCSSCWGWGVRDAWVVGHVRSHTMCMLLPIHDLWVPKYVNWWHVIVCTFIYPFVVTNKLPYLFQAMRCRTPACSAVSPGDNQCDVIPRKHRMNASGTTSPSLARFWTTGGRRPTHSTSPSARWRWLFRTCRCWWTFLVRASRWGLRTSPLSGVQSSSLGSRTFLGTIAPSPRTRSSRTLMDPPWLGCSSLGYVPLPHISLCFWRYGDNVTNVWFCLCRLIT